MTETSNQPAVSPNRWRASHAYAMAAICLFAGLLIGYLFRGSASPGSATGARPDGVTPSVDTAGGQASRAMPSLEQMKHMADKQAEPLLQKLQADPNNPDLLVHLADIYQATHQFREAVGYFEKALAADPKNAATRTAMASCLYYTGDADGAIRQLEQAVKDDPGNANALFNLGLIRWQGKKDGIGATTAWRQLLKANPRLEAGKKHEVEQLIAEVGSKPN